jgi:hypothetical protein
MTPLTTPQRITAAGCVALSVVPYLAHAPGYAWYAGIASLAAGMVLGPRGILLVVAISFALIAATYLTVQVDAVSGLYGDGEEERKLASVHTLLKDAMALGSVAAFGLVLRGLITGAIAP